MKEIAEIIRNEFHSTEYDEVDACGSFLNETNNKGKLITPGSVYGFFVSLSGDEKEELFQEAQLKQTLRPTNTSLIQPIKDNVYVLYWGKDKSLGARINAHVNNPKGKTGLARLSAYTSLHGKFISCFAIVVNNYSGFEAHLQRKFPDILKTKSREL